MKRCDLALRVPLPVAEVTAFGTAGVLLWRTRDELFLTEFVRAFNLLGFWGLVNWLLHCSSLSSLVRIAGNLLS